MNQSWSQTHFPGVLPESAERDRERRDRAQRVPIDPLKAAVWSTFFAAVLLFWALVVWLAVG